MYSIAYIREQNSAAAIKARRLGQGPRVFFDDADRRDHCGSVPNFGDHRPKGWRIVEERQVDNSGAGSEAEPALTLRGYQQWLAQYPESGFAIISVGPFQVWVGRFERTRSNPAIRPGATRIPVESFA